MARSYSLPTIKMLFAEASHCAYPDCNESLVFEDPARGVRSIAVQIAHIRSEKVDGPRYDRTYDKTLINTPDNLLLMCGKHHTAVDQNEATFTIEELVEWQSAQRSQGGGTTVSDAELTNMMQTLEASLAALYGLMSVSLGLNLLGARIVGNMEVVTMPLQALGQVTLPEGTDPKVLVGVEVVNKSASGVSVSAGFEFDLGQDDPMRWIFHGAYCPPASPHRLKGHDSQAWLQDAGDVRETVLEASRRIGFIPPRFRVFAARRDDVTERGEWHDIVELPIWQPEVTQEWVLEQNSKTQPSST
ncbi:HNH endonuclease [Microbacterium sp.]|uniref:HNH endonuclease n=1 Tax=Microbacterium sp. TaxID=51671 RepID=UPI0028119693|nr:HNH endonuclease [Microbacterium sp.]